MTKKFLFLVLFLCLLPAYGRSAESTPPKNTENISADSPEQVLLAYIKAAGSGDLKKAYAMLSEKDRETIRFYNYKSIYYIYLDPLNIEFFRTSKTEILNSKISQNTAEITVALEVMNIAELSQAEIEIRRTKPEGDISQELKTYFNGKIPSLTLGIKYTLIKEGNTWKITDPELVNYFKDRDLDPEHAKAMDVLMEYIEAQYDGNLEKAYSMLCERDRKDFSLEDYISWNREFLFPQYKGFYARAKTEFTKSHLTENSFLVTLRQDFIDISALLHNPEGAPIPVLTQKASYFLRKENNKWKLSIYTQRSD